MHPEDGCGPPLGLGWQHYTDCEWQIEEEELIALFSNGVLGVSDQNNQVLSINQFQVQLQEWVDCHSVSLPVSVCHRLKEYQTSELLLDDIAFTMLARTDGVLVTDKDTEILLESGTTTS